MGISFAAYFHFLCKVIFTINNVPRLFNWQKPLTNKSLISGFIYIMKRNQPLIFSLIIDYQGNEIPIKAGKCTYAGNEILYKVVLPSFLCTSPICWISGSCKHWSIVLGIVLDKNLEQTLLNAIGDLEKINTIYPKIVNAELQSA
jgi:hypothetical protein